MTRPSKNPTIADLYLAFRQAKTALYFERRGVGLQILAEYEQKLPANLKSLKTKVTNGKWVSVCCLKFRKTFSYLIIISKNFHPRKIFV